MGPQDVQAVRFREGWRGYDEHEVDDFMSRVAHALQILITERDEAVARADRLAREADQVAETEHLLRRTLLTAERTAEETVQRAHVDADLIRSEARAEAERLRIEAHERATRQIEEASEAVDRIRRAVSDFRAFRDGYLDRVRAVIDEHRAALDRVGDVPELPDRAAEFEALSMESTRWLSDVPGGTVPDPPSVLTFDDDPESAPHDHAETAVPRDASTEASHTPTAS